MRIAVLGATGTMGSRVSDLLENAGHDVVRVSTTLGYDLTTSKGVERALEGADTVVDCLNIDTMSRRRATSFFGKSAQLIAHTAKRMGVKRIVCVSIFGVQSPEVSKRFGYYAGKATQENTYLHAEVPVTIIRSTQWFEFLPTLDQSLAFGPIAALPSMRIAPVAADEVACFMVREIENTTDETPHFHTCAIRGPKILDAKAAVQTWVAIRGEIAGKRPRWIICFSLGSAVANGALIPEEASKSPITLDDYLQGLQ